MRLPEIASVTVRSDLLGAQGIVRSRATTSAWSFDRCMPPEPCRRLRSAARSDGKPQVTYDGHPLYHFDGDHGTGQANGQGVTTFGGGWFALSSNGSAVSGTGSNSGGGVMATSPRAA
jgi:hypothetical protein